MKEAPNVICAYGEAYLYAHNIIFRIENITKDKNGNIKPSDLLESLGFKEVNRIMGHLTPDRTTLIYEADLIDVKDFFGYK